MTKLVDIDDLKNTLVAMGAACKFTLYLIDIQPTINIQTGEYKNGRDLTYPELLEIRQKVCSKCSIPDEARSTRCLKRSEIEE